MHRPYPSDLTDARWARPKRRRYRHYEALASTSLTVPPLRKRCPTEARPFARKRIRTLPRSPTAAFETPEGPTQSQTLRGLPRNAAARTVRLRSAIEFVAGRRVRLRSTIEFVAPLGAPPRRVPRRRRRARGALFVVQPPGRRERRGPRRARVARARARDRSRVPHAHGSGAGGVAVNAAPRPASLHRDGGDVGREVVDVVDLHHGVRHRSERVGHEEGALDRRRGVRPPVRGPISRGQISRANRAPLELRNAPLVGESAPSTDARGRSACRARIGRRSRHAR